MIRIVRFMVPFVFLAASCFASTVICTETASGPTAGNAANGLRQGGCVESYITGYTFASDGEVYFDPFGYGADTSDGIQFPAAARYNFILEAGVSGWVQVTTATSVTWVLPANLTSIGCGAEPNTTCEPIGKWQYPVVADWGGAAGSYIMLEANGSVSDTITLDYIAGGYPEIIFQSDADIPEPSSMSLVLLGLAGLAWRVAARRKRV